MKHIIFPLLLIVMVSITACLIKPPDPVPEPWSKLEGYLNNTNIRLLHATSSELYILSDDEFARIDRNNELVEKRRYGLPSSFSSRPAMTDDSYFYLIRNTSGKIELNFYLTQNPDPIKKILLEDFMQPDDSEFLEENEARNTGVYNATGTQFIIPVIRIPDSYYAFFLFDINLNASKTEFESIELSARIDVTDLPAFSGNLSNVKFIDGYFYATSEDGAVRIDPSNGTYEKIFNTWMLDVFKYDGKIYATGFGNNLFVSSNNGMSFTSVDLGATPPQFQMIEVINDEIFTQQTVGFPYSVVNSDFSESKRLLLNEDFTEDFSAYQDIEYFNGNYYLPVFKELYLSSELLTIE